MGKIGRYRRRRTAQTPLWHTQCTKGGGGGGGGECSQKGRLLGGFKCGRRKICQRISEEAEGRFFEEESVLVARRRSIFVCGGLGPTSVDLLPGVDTRSCHWWIELQGASLSKNKDKCSQDKRSSSALFSGVSEVGKKSTLFSTEKKSIKMAATPTPTPGPPASIKSSTYYQFGRVEKGGEKRGSRLSWMDSSALLVVQSNSDKREVIFFPFKHASGSTIFGNSYPCQQTLSY